MNQRSRKLPLGMPVVPRCIKTERMNCPVAHTGGSWKQVKTTKLWQRSILAVLLLTGITCGWAGAAEVFSTFGPDDSYNGFGGYVICSVIPGFFSYDQDMADHFIFSGTQSYTLDSV